MEEDRGQAIGRAARVHVPAELRHYPDKKRFLALQVAGWMEKDYPIPDDEADLAQMIDRGEMVEVPADLLTGGEHYALEVAGDSMMEAGILDGDVVVIRQGDAAESGAIVVALIDENEVTLKRLRQRGNSVALEPANAAYETRIFGPGRVRVQGRLVGLIRKYH